jgi:hypothetical protein
MASQPISLVNLNACSILMISVGLRFPKLSIYFHIKIFCCGIWYLINVILSHLYKLLIIHAEFDDPCCLSIYLSIYLASYGSTVLFLGPWPLFQFLNLIHSR